MKIIGERAPEEERACVEEIEATVSAPTASVVRRALFRGGVLAALGRRDYRLLWSGAFISNIGTWIHTTALLWFVKELTDSNAWVGAVNFANFVPVLLLVVYAGSLADRLNRKKLIAVNQAVMMLGALALGVLVSLGLDSMAVVIVVTFIMGVAFALNFPAWQAILPDLVPGEDLINGIALSAAQFNLARFVGPALGALVLNWWGVAPAFYLNAVSFFAVIGALFLIRTKTPPYPPHPEGTGKHIMEGLRHIWANRWALNLLIVLGITSFFGLPYIVLMPSVARDVLNRGAGGYGLLLGLSGLGAVIGAPLVTYLNRHLKERDILKVAEASLGLLLIAFSVSRIYWVSVLIAVGLGCSYLMLSSSVNTVLQSGVARDIRGRVMSFYVLMLIGIFPVGGLAMGFVSDVRSTPFALMLGGTACLATAVVLISAPGLTRDAVSPDA